MTPLRRRGERGFALLIVLWTLSLLALLGTVITAAGRAETRLAANLRGSAVAEAAADAAVFEAVYHLLDASQGRWAADGAPHEVVLPNARARVTITNRGGRIDINMASLPLLQALLHQLGVDGHSAIAVAAAIADWRSPSTKPLPNGAKAAQYRAAGLAYGPPNAPFRHVDELAMVLGITPALFDAMQPYVALHLEGPPEPAVASPTVLRALADAAAAGGEPVDVDVSDRPLVVMIDAVATAADGSRFARQMELRVNLGTSSSAGRPPYEILGWTSPAA